jgi:tetratricopeptide (TPR) repeat protein
LFGYKNNFRTTENIKHQLRDLDIVINSYLSVNSKKFSSEITILSLQSHRRDLENELNDAIISENIIQIVNEAARLKDNGDYQLAKTKLNYAFDVTIKEFNEYHPLSAEILFYKSVIDQLLELYDIALANFLKLKKYNARYNYNNINTNSLLDYHISLNFMSPIN